jgi:alginate O-acetyltransferase complex protein AlgI
MLFNSLSYLLFLPPVAVILYLIPGRYQWFWLLACSTFFYYTLLPVFLILFYALILINYYLGIVIESSESNRNQIFIISVCINIIVLAFFKYFGFFQSLFSDIKGLSANDHLLKIILPVGLSFFIFTILSYLIEVKRGTIKAERHIGIFASSLLFFPKIMQGPIEKPGNIFPQFREVKSFNYDNVVEGLKLMVWGYFKKLVIADRLAIYVNAVYDNYEHHSGISLLVATIFYSFQIYADFSGYTDIALGSAKVMGFNLTNNFNRPYFATSVKEFWNRWHISLSIWLRDYLFLPLAVVFAGKFKEIKLMALAVEKWIFMFASLITFAVCGLWHGEGLNFLIWGLLFGIYMSIANWTLGLDKKFRKKFGISTKSASYRIYGILITFILVTFAWIFFRSRNLTDAFLIIKKIYLFSGTLYTGEIRRFLISIIGIIFLFIIDMRTEYFSHWTFPFKNGIWLQEQMVYAFLIILILLLGVFDGGQFLYFQF